MAAHQTQHPLARHTHPVLTAQPCSPLAIALAAGGRSGDHAPDEPHQLVIGNGSGRSRTTGRPRLPDTPGVDSGAGHLEHPTHHRQGMTRLHPHLGPFGGGICSPLFDSRLQDLVLHGQLPDLALRLPQTSLLMAGLTAVAPLRPSRPAAMNSSRKALGDWASDARLEAAHQY